MYFYCLAFTYLILIHISTNACVKRRIIRLSLHSEFSNIEVLFK